MSKLCFCNQPELLGLGGLCRVHFNQQRIAPLVKELANAEETVARLRSLLLQQQRLLFNADTEQAKWTKRALASETKGHKLTKAERASMVRQGNLKALGFMFCKFCSEPFDLKVEHWQHEQSCKSKTAIVIKHNNRGTRKPPAQKVKNVQGVLEDDLEGL